MVLALAVLPQNVRKDLINDDAEFDALGLKNIKNMAKVGPYMVKTGANAHVLCTVLKLFF